ncbi:cytochrome P450 [Roridomyces roridus]|uniref:Cytochrome P450 n=1 Tax=Roridomyces roridus TaxID=1738132 RepID=A0AAD7CK16_9AGAR|nr:cytochrome P450 [Roridomyces roridus]
MTPSPTLLTVLAAVISHLIFNRLEPRGVPSFAALLVLPPSILSILAPRDRSILMIFLMYFSAILASVVLYRISPFHPLASYPGPVLCKISKLWLAGISLGGKQHVYYRDLHRRYGDVVRVGPNELSFCDKSAVAPMLGTRGMPKGPWWDGRNPENKKVRSLLGLRDPEEHQRRRRIWHRAFSASALKEYDLVVRNRLSQLVEILVDNSGKSMDLTQWMGHFMYDVMNDIVFGGGVELMRDGDKHGLYALFENFLPMALLMSHVPWLGELTLWIPGFAKDVKKFRAHAINCAIERKLHGSPRKDLFYHLIDEAGIEAEPPSLPQVVCDAAPAITAGAETTSTALCNLIWLLLSNPITYSRLQVEIDSLGPAVLNSEAQKRSVYLNACIDETLRLFPAVLSGSQRAPLIGSGGHRIGTNFIPEGTSAVVHSYTLQRDPRYFSSPDSFIPERWLSIDEQRTLKPAMFKGDDQIMIHDTAAFIPFSFGPANCIGKALAYQEMRLVICTLMTKFNLAFEVGFDARTWEVNLRDYYILSKGKLPVVFSPRA